MIYQEKLGVYRVGDFKFYSKLEAIEMQSKTGIHPHWDFNEAVFSTYDWTQEPAERLTDLYRRRAEQLREKYDYIVLFYSGGSDSQTVLESFVDNDIHINEIVSWSNYEATKDKNHFFNAETYCVAIPEIERFKKKHPGLQHRILDLSQLTVNSFLETDAKFDWIYNQNSYFTPGTTAKNDLPLKIPEWHNILLSGKRLCLLWGMDKPRIYHEDERFCVKFLDIVDNGPSVRSIAGLNPWHDELFFWTPDLPQIVIKQAHVIKNYLNQNFDKSPFISHEVSKLAYKIHQGQKYWLNNHGVHRLIYPNWNIDTFSVGKSSSVIFTRRDDWFRNMQHDRSRNIWKMGIEKLWNSLPDYWKNDPLDISKGFKLCVSKSYFLDKDII